MKDLEYIKKFAKITVTGACRKVKVDRSSLLSNRVKEEKAKAVREEIESELAKLYLKGKENE